MELRKRLPIAFALIAFFLGLNSSYAEEPLRHATVLINNSGKMIGTVVLTQGSKGVLINIAASELPSGYRGMHFHSVADCSDHATFATAKGHVDPHKKPHGFLNPEGPHEGNLPNLVVAKDGSVEVELYSDMVSLVGGDANLLDDDGSALIIHEKRDDHLTQPIGGAGGRIACAEIKRKK